MPDPAKRPPSAILETCLTVADVARSRAFYTDLFGYPVIAGDERFCGLDVDGSQVLLLFLKGSDPEGGHLPFGYIPPHGTTGTAHIGFRIPESSLAEWEALLAGRGIAIESRFTWPPGGTSIYFRDPDGHLIELLTPGVWPTY